MSIFTRKHEQTVKALTARAESAEGGMAYWRTVAGQYLDALNDMDRTHDLLLDYIDGAHTGINLLAGIAHQQEDVIESLTGDVQALRAECAARANANETLTGTIAALQARLNELDPPRKNHAQTPQDEQEPPVATPDTTTVNQTEQAIPASRRRA